MGITSQHKPWIRIELKYNSKTCKQTHNFARLQVQNWNWYSASHLKTHALLHTLHLKVIQFYSVFLSLRHFDRSGDDRCLCQSVKIGRNFSAISAMPYLLLRPSLTKSSISKVCWMTFSLLFAGRSCCLILCASSLLGLSSQDLQTDLIFSFYQQ